LQGERRRNFMERDLMTNSTTALVIHGHFYQPPRENPWTDDIEHQPSAHPFPNWNERVARECYRPNAFARIVDNYGRVERIVNNYSLINFNFGATLLSWLERFHPDTYARILEADRTSALRRGGHGNAIAQGYHHSILPLCNERDMRTEIRWGIADFRQRFRREPESLWLPETACNDATLGALIDEGLKYVILSPFQAERVRPAGSEVWLSVIDGQLDTTVPYRYLHTDGSGRSLAIFFYDGQLARAIAFDGVLSSSHMLLDRFERSARAGDGEGIVHVATDGESYGHHFKFGERCLAYGLEVEAAARGLWITNYGEFLASRAPEWEVELKAGADGEGTAWSCAHGVGRWTRDCSCHASAPEGWNQKWRTPLRAALNYVRDEAARLFETQGAELFQDPWSTRDAYVELLCDPQRDRAEFFERQSKRSLSEAQRERALTLLELQRSSLLMFTSCGWFFNDISGIETVQVLKYAARVMDFMGELESRSPRAEFLELLAGAQSNIRKHGTGADIFRELVETARVTPQRIAASLAISSLLDKSEQDGELAGHTFSLTNFRQEQHGRLALATGRLILEAVSTGKRMDFAVAAMHVGDIDFYCVLKEFPGADAFAGATETLWSQFRTGSVPMLLRLMQEDFGPADFGLEHLLPAGRQRIYEIVFGRMVGRFSRQYEYLYEDNRRNIEMLQEVGFHLPEELRAAAEFTITRRLEREINKFEQKRDPAAFREALRIAHEVARLGYRLDRASMRRKFENLIVATVRACVGEPQTESQQDALALIDLANELSLHANLERAQEIVYEALQRERAHAENIEALVVKLGLAPSLSQEIPANTVAANAAVKAEPLAEPVRS
jgi:alpha-amylase/alpha-mannosidase (GH57 family)